MTADTKNRRDALAAAEAAYPGGLQDARRAYLDDGGTAEAFLTDPAVRVFAEARGGLPLGGPLLDRAAAVWWDTRPDPALRPAGKGETMNSVAIARAQAERERLDALVATLREELGRVTSSSERSMLHMELNDAMNERAELSRRLYAAGLA